MSAATEKHPQKTPPRQYQGRITGIDDVLPDTRVLKVSLDNRAVVPFQAGQYARLSFGGMAARPFSIASAPGQPEIEFHIRNTGRGDGARALDELAMGAPVTVEAPLGDHYWRPSARPVLALAGGMGIAPIKSILSAHLASARHAPARLYWGVRDAAQLYLDRHFQGLAREYPGFGYIPVPFAGDNGKYRTGAIAPHVVEDFPALSEFAIYMSGPPAMVENTLPLLLQHGADPAHVFCDGMEETAKK